MRPLSSTKAAEIPEVTEVEDASRYDATTDKGPEVTHIEVVPEYYPTEEVDSTVNCISNSSTQKPSVLRIESALAVENPQSVSRPALSRRRVAFNDPPPSIESPPLDDTPHPTVPNNPIPRYGSGKGCKRPSNYIQQDDISGRTYYTRQVSFSHHNLPSFLTRPTPERYGPSRADLEDYFDRAAAATELGATTPMRRLSNRITGSLKRTFSFGKSAEPREEKVQKLGELGRTRSVGLERNSSWKRATRRANTVAGSMGRSWVKKRGGAWVKERECERAEISDFDEEGSGREGVEEVESFDESGSELE